MGSSHTPFATAASQADPGIDDGHRGPGRIPTHTLGAFSLLSAPSGRPPLPLCGLSGGCSARKASLANILLDDSFDNLLPLSPSLDNFLTHAGSNAAGMDSRPSMLNGRPFSMSGGRLNSFDLGWLMGDGIPGGASERGRSGGVEESEAMQVDGGSAAQHAQRSTAPSGAPTWQERAQQGSLKRRHSTAELVVGCPQLGPPLPAVPPLLVQATPMQPGQVRGTTAPHTPHTPTCADGAKKAALEQPEAGMPTAQRRRQSGHREPATAATAAATGAAATVAAAAQDPAQGYAAQCQAAAAHAAQAMALQQQMQMQQAALGCSWGGAGTHTVVPTGLLGRAGVAGGSAGSNSSNSSGTTQCNAELLAQYSASQAAATAAIYGRPLAPSPPLPGQLAALKSGEAGGGLAGLAWAAGGGGGSGMGGLPGSADPFAAAAAGARWDYGNLCGGTQQAAYPSFDWQTQGQPSQAACPQTMPAQRSGGASSIQAKIDEWERQNALMAAFSSGNAFPELAASAACTPQGLMWAAAAGAAAAAPYASSYGGFPQPNVHFQYPQYPQQYAHYPQQHQQQYQHQPRSIQVTMSTAPALKLATTGPTPVKVASKAADRACSGGDVAISSDSEEADAPAAPPAGPAPTNPAPANAAPTNTAPVGAAAALPAGEAGAPPSLPAVTAGADEA